jgi:hypothetical protein
VSHKTREQKEARALQKRTDWKYQECLRCVRTMTPEAIEALIKVRKGMVPPESDRTKP